MLWIGIILISIVVHELGHALTARAFGQRAAITLTGMGGYTQRSGKKLSFWQEFLIVLNGPLAGFALAAAAFFTLNRFEADISPIFNYILTVTLYMNVFWTLFNLCPVPPLDGGRLMTVVLEALMGFRGVRLAYFFGMALAGILGLAAFGVGMMFPGIFFFFFAFENYRSWSAFRGVVEQDGDKAWWDEIRAAEKQAARGEYREAYAHLEKIRQEVPEGKVNIAAAEQQGGILVRQGKVTEAFNLLMPLQKKLSVGFLNILHELAFKTGHIKIAATLGDDLYQQTPTYAIAILNAKSRALLGEEHAAIGWLRRAKTDGAPNFNQIILQAEFDAIRHSPAFNELLE